MFNDLPLEILVEIFIPLHQQHKVECMTVCRYWKDVIQTHCLFDTLRIDNLTQLDMVTKKLEEEPSRKNQVKQLLLDLELDDRFDAVGFINQFSSLQSIYMKKVKDEQFQEIARSSFQTNRINFMLESESHSMIPSLLKSTIFPQLTRIRITTLGTSDDYFNKDIIPLLANAPSLEQLTIPITRMTFEKFENLHKSLPFLKVFYTLLVMNDTNPLPTNILPANAMTTFRIHNFYRKGDIATKLFQYFCLKYPNLENFTFMSNRREDGTTENVQQFCQLGLYPFLRKVAYKLDDYSIDMDIDKSPDTLPDYFGVLDKADCKIKSFTFEDIPVAEKFAQFMQSNLIKHVEKLSFRYVEFKDFKSLAEFPVLKDIEILDDPLMDDIQLPEFRLSDFLGLCSDKLECLSISKFSVQFDSADKRQYSIKTLRLYKCTLPKRLDRFISKSLPHLHTLYFYEIILSKLTLRMPKINLTAFIIEDCDVCDVLVHTTSDNQQHLWTVKANNKTLLCDLYSCYDANWIPAITTEHFSQFNRMFAVKLVCASLKNIDIRIRY